MCYNVLPINVYFHLIMYLLAQNKKYKGKVYKYYSIARSYRDENGISRTQVVQRIGKLSDTEARQLKYALKVAQAKEKEFIALDDIIFEDHKAYLDVSVLNWIWESSGLSSIFPSQKPRNHISTLEIAKILAFNRCIDPGSKSYAASWVKRTELDRILNIDTKYVNDDKIYHELTNIERCKPLLEKRLFNKIKEESPESLRIVFYDLTTTYFEGTHCELASPGRTKSHGMKNARLVLSLIITEKGVPFSWEVHPGDTMDVETIETKLTKLQQQFNIKDITLVFDRGMVSQDNLNLLEERGYKYISALDKDEIGGIKGIDFEMFKGINEENAPTRLLNIGFQKYCEDLYFKELPASKERRFVLGYNPTLARDERQTREERIKKLYSYVENRNRALQKAKKSINKNSLQYAVNRELTKRHLKRLFSFELIPLPLKGKTRSIESFQINLTPNTEKIEKAKLKDGLCVFISNVPLKDGNTDFPPQKLIESYREKDKIEQAFKNIKSYIEIRPIYVFTEEHVRAHYTLCVLAYFMNIQILNCVRERFLEFRSCERIYNELSRGIVGTFGSLFSTRSVKKLSSPTESQKKILQALGCQHLITHSYLRSIGI